MEQLKTDLLKEARALKRTSGELSADILSQMTPLMLGILQGQVSPLEDISSKIPRNKVLHFISSTFEDTQFEQDYLLVHCFPFLREFCDVLGLDFNVVSMRWGVRARAGNDHRTSEMCMDELHRCLDQSVGLAYVALQSHRYGFQPFPRIIEHAEFNAIKKILEDCGRQVVHLESPYWKLNTSIVPCCYELQPIASLPGLADYLISDEDKRRMNNDDAFKDSRLASRSKASALWWSLFESMQNLLRDGAVLLSDKEQQDFQDGSSSIWEKYFISVTHDEVNNGLLCNELAHEQAIYIERNIEGIETCHVIDKSEAPRFKDDDKNKFDPRGITTLHRLLKQRVRTVLPPDRCFEYSVPFIGDGKLSKSQPTPPVEWAASLEKFGTFYIVSSCQALLTNYKTPPPPIAMELMRQHMAIYRHMQESIFDRSSEISLVVNYCAAVAASPAETAGVSNEHVLLLQSMGEWSESQCISALKQVNGDFDKAVGLLVEGRNENSPPSTKAKVTMEQLETLRLMGKWTERQYFDALQQADNFDEAVGLLVEGSKAEEASSYTPLILHGKSGAGKSWIISKAIEVMINGPQLFPMVVYRMLGCSVDSSSVLRLIHSIDQQIALMQSRRPQLNEETSFEKAAEWFAQGGAFVSATLSSPLVIILDGLDQLHDSNRVLDDIGQWCPGIRYPLPKHAKLVLTSTSQLKGRSLKSKINFRMYSTETLKGKQDMLIEISDLPLCDLQVVQNQFKSALDRRPLPGYIVPVKHVLSERHLVYISELLMAYPSALSSVLLLDIAAKWPSHYFDESRAVANAAAQGSRGLIHVLIQELEAHHGRMLVEAVLSLLTLSVDGLSISEIEDLVSTMDEVLDDVFEWWVPPIRRIPPMLVHRLLRDFERYIGEQGARGGDGGVYQWYHQQFADVTKERYLSDAGRCQHFYSILGKYFAGLLDPEMVEKRRLTRQTLTKHGLDVSIWSRTSLINVRRITEGASALISAGCLPEAVGHLCSIPQVCAYLKSNSASELLIELFLIREEYAKADHLNEPVILQHFLSWLNADMTTLITHPELSIFTTVALQPRASIARSDALSILTSTDSNAVIFDRDMWVRCKQLGNRDDEFKCTKVVLAGHDYKVTSSSWSCDGRQLASTSWGNCIRVWTVDTGEKVSYFKDCNVSQADWIKWSPNCQYIASYPAMSDNEILIWEPLSNNTLKGFPDCHLLYWCPFSPSTLMCSISSDFRTCTVTDSEYWNQACAYKAIDDEDCMVHAVWVTYCQILLVSMGQVKLWDINKNVIEFTLSGVLKCYSAKGEFIVMYIGETLCMFNTRSMEIVHQFVPNVYNKGVKCSLNAQGDKLAINQMNGAVWYRNAPNEWLITDILAPYRREIWDEKDDCSDSDLDSDDSNDSDKNSSPNVFGTTVIFIDGRNTKVVSFVEHHVWNNQGTCVLLIRKKSKYPDSKSSRYLNSTLIMINPISGEQFRTELGPIQSWSLSPDDKFVAAGTNSIHHAINIIHCAELSDATGADTSDDAVVKEYDQANRALCWIPNSSLVATASYNHSISLYCSKTNDIVTSLNCHEESVSCVAVSPCGVFLAAGSDDRSVSVWQYDVNLCEDSSDIVWRRCAVLTEHSDCIRGVGFGKTENDSVYNLVTASLDGIIVVHELSFQETDPAVNAMFKIDVNGSSVMNTVEKDRSQLRSDNESSKITSLECNPVLSGLIIVGTSDGKAQVWDLTTKSIISEVHDEHARIANLPCVPVAWRPDGYYYAIGCAYLNGLEVYDVGSTAPVFTLSDRSKRNMMNSDWIFQIAWNDSGNRIASCSAHSYIRVWDIENQQLLILLEGHTGNVFGVSWNSKNQLASCGEDGVLRVWDAVNVADLV